MESRPSVRRRALWGALVVLLLVAQTLLIWLTIDYEASWQQERVDEAASDVAGQLRQRLARDLQDAQALSLSAASPQRWRAEAAELMRQRRPLLRIEQRDDAFTVTDVLESPYTAPLFSVLKRDDIDVDTELACTAVQRLLAPAYSRSYFVPQPGGLGLEVIDLCLPLQQEGRADGFFVVSFGLAALLADAAGDSARAYELSFIEGDGTRLARAGMPRGLSVYVAERLIDLPGTALRLRTDSAEDRPRLIPNLATALVIGLSLALLGLVLLLNRDVRRRARAEARLAEALAFRKAMEDSLVTGLRARDRDGRVTYANPAFCAMVGFSAEALRDAPTPPYWPPEMVDEYARRQRERLAGSEPPREGFETVFMRKSGERFPVMIYEAPLVDGSGRHTGWMSAVLDVSAQRRVEELSRQQQERLQASARLASVGEMASLLSHELNQPLAAIASYATGTLNLLREPDADAPTLARQAIERIAEQAERAGRVIRSVHTFVRRRERTRETVFVSELVDAVLPLALLQARRIGARIDAELPEPVPKVVCDRTLVEQVLLNLTRNGLQAMDPATPLSDRLLTLRARQTHARWVTFSVIDRGVGIAPDTAQRLFTPFFTTRNEGMGLGLSLCRTVIEQHGGALDFDSRVAAADGTGGWTEFRFTLPSA